VLDQGYLFAFTKLMDQILQLAVAVWYRQIEEKKKDEDFEISK